ncbi:MBL fold metallo-hydrolase [Pseudonocardia sp. GCM10023141]|uniref:MBL fold metallo-hydrolase n=1 Tax=Pseudonocardia sp. GCM10023141 TaxID=3252653 RepID=UPI00360A81EE
MPRTPGRALLAVLASFVLFRLAQAARGVPRAIGAGGPRLRVSSVGSPHAVNGRFANSEPGAVIEAGSGPALIGRLFARDRIGRPTGMVPLATTAPDGPAGELAVTWFGHSSVLLEVDGQRVLADPMWSERASPSAAIGPRRLHPAPRPLAELPAVDAVLISHDHYDHLDVPSVRALVEHSAAPFVVPLGIGAHLRRWGVPADRVVELDWTGTTQVGGLTLGCAEARHFSGRGLTRNTTQWSSWVVAGPRHRTFFGGDTGYTAAFARTRVQYGAFDLTLLPIGAYSDHWPDIHMTPEEAVQAHVDLAGSGAGLLVPVHWATFDLGFHAWAEPVERLRAAAAAAGVALALPIPGERIDAQTPPAVRDWWTSLSP